MRPRHTRSSQFRPLRIFGALLALVAADALMTSPARADELFLRGVLRDFSAGHPDFNVTPPGGSGHVASNVNVELDGRGRPFHVPGGFRVVADWTDDAGNPMAPHLYNPGGVARGLLVNNGVYIRAAAIDSFDSTQGPFGGANNGDAALLMTNLTADDTVEILNAASIRGQVHVGAGADPGDVIDIDGNCTITRGTGTLGGPMAMPVITEPGDLGPSAGNMAVGSGPFSGDHHVDTLTISNGQTVSIQGRVTILCEGDFIAQNACIIELAPDATLDLYVKGNIALENNTRFNVNTHDPSRVRIHLIGPGIVDCQNGNRTYAAIVAPEGVLYVHNGAQVGGRFVADRLRLQNQGAMLHVDSARIGVCAPLADVAGTGGLPSNGGIDSAGSFAEWFRDVPSSNLSTRHTIVVPRDGAGVYTYLDDAFLPLDDRLFGNEGDAHNYHFTYAIDADFVYRSCWQQWLQLEGGDGVWIFIDGKLVVDIGGVQPLTDQFIHVDRLGLVDGDKYRLQIFYAQRHKATSQFHLRTTIELTQPDLGPTVSAMFD